MSNINELKRIKDTLNSVIDSKINEADIKETSMKADKLSIGEIKYLFERISERLFDAEGGRKIITSFIGTCSASRPVQKFFEITENIKNVQGVSDNVTFINEIFDMYEKIDKNTVNELRNIISEGMSIAGLSSSEFDKIFNEYDTSVDKLISESIALSKTPSNAKKRSNSIYAISEMLGDRSEELVDEYEGLDKKELLEKVNELINSTPGFGKLMEDMFINHLMGGDNETIFESYKNKCIENIDYIMENNEGSCDIERMRSLKEGLDNKRYNEDTFHDDIISLCEIENLLKEDKESC